MKKILAFFGLVFFLSACTEKMVTIPDYVPPESNRVVLIEEFTGASCPNCPDGAAAVADILSFFPDNVVAVGIHSDFLGFPAKPEDLDLRTDFSREIERFLGSWRSKPEAAFNRVKYDDQENIRVQDRPATWIGFVQRELEEFSPFDLSVTTAYDGDSRQVDFVVKAKALENVVGDYKLHVLITEDDIVAAQKNVTTTIEKYKHKHVLRTQLTPVEGESWFQALTDQLERERSFSFVLPDEEEMGWWKPQDCNIVAYITDGAEKKVIQAVEVDVLSL